MKKILYLRPLLCVFLLGVHLSPQAPPGPSADNVYLGILDDAREEMLNWRPGVAQKRVIRPAFERTHLGWEEVDASSLPPRTKWTIAFDGRRIGQIESQAESSEGLTAVQAILTSADTVPSVGQPSQDFGGLITSGQTKVRRPLIAVSKPYFRDPDSWKRTRLPEEITGKVREAFRHEFPHANRCKDEEVLERDWKFPDSALAFPIAYASNKKSFLVEASLNAGDCGYVDEPDDPLSDPWFFVTADGNVRRIGSFLTLLDAGDYDNDGKSELVFFLSQGENTDGFVLFNASLEKQSTLMWHYH